MIWSAPPSNRSLTIRPCPSCRSHQKSTTRRAPASSVMLICPPSGRSKAAKGASAGTGRVEGRPKVVEAQLRSEAARRRLELEIAVELGGMAAAVRHEGEVPGKAFAAAPQGGIEALRFPGDAELLVGDGQRRVDDPNFV